MAFIWQIGPWLSSSDSIRRRAAAGQKRSGLQVPRNAMFQSHRVTLGRRIFAHEANVDLSKESILESRAENKAFGSMTG